MCPRPPPFLKKKVGESVEKGRPPIEEPVPLRVSVLKHRDLLNSSFPARISSSVLLLLDEGTGMLLLVFHARSQERGSPPSSCSFFQAWERTSVADSFRQCRAFGNREQVQISSEHHQGSRTFAKDSHEPIRSKSTIHIQYSEQACPAPHNYCGYSLFFPAVQQPPVGTL